MVRPVRGAGAMLRAGRPVASPPGGSGRLVTPSKGGTDRMLPRSTLSHLHLDGRETACGDRAHPMMTWGHLWEGGRFPQGLLEGVFQRISADPCRVNPPRTVVNWSTTRLHIPRGPHQPVPTKGEPDVGQAGRQRMLCSPVKINTSPGYLLPGLGCNMGVSYSLTGHLIQASKLS